MSELSGPQTLTKPSSLKNFTSTESLKEGGVCLDGISISIANPDADGNG